MRWASALVEGEHTPLAAQELVVRLRRDLDGLEPHLVLLFPSAVHIPHADALAAILSTAFPTARVLGCGAGGVAADGREREGQPSVAAAAAHLPDVEVVPFHVTLEQAALRLANPESWHEILGVVPEHQPVFVLLPDPFTCDAGPLVMGLDKAYPSSPKVGGLASGGDEAGGQALILDDTVHRDGAVGVALYGDIGMDTIVAQGARPVGRAHTVTDCDGHLIRTLDHRPVIEVLEEEFGRMTQAERARFQRSAMIGLAMESRRGDAPLPGEFLVRNILGASRKDGVLAVGAHLTEGQLVQLHVRSAKASADDLDNLLGRYMLVRGESPAGGLMFSCLGRGARFFGVPDHDSRHIQAAIGDVPLAGFFCNGEIGPVHGRTWLHGYTSSIGLFHSRGWS